MIKVDRNEFDKICLLVKEWRKRTRAVRSQFLYVAVDNVYKDLLSYIPSEYTDLKRSLHMQRIQGLPDTIDGYVIRALPRKMNITKEDSNSVVIYVSAKTNLMRSVPEATKILEDFSPWTTEMIPYAPDPKTATVISRRVSPREVNRVRQLRNRDKVVWRRRAKEAGIKIERTIFQPRPRELASVPDVAFESLRLEFGLGGSPSKPHWRKAILKLALRGEAGMIARKREFIRTMTDSTFRAWERWPTKVSEFATVAESQRYVPFQQRLGLRVG